MRVNRMASSALYIFLVEYRRSAILPKMKVWSGRDT